MQAATTSSEKMPADAKADGNTAGASGGDDSTPRILALAAAFGFEVAPDLLAPEASDRAAGADGETADAPMSPAIAAAIALGVGSQDSASRVPRAESSSPESRGETTGPIASGPVAGPDEPGDNESAADLAAAPGDADDVPVPAIRAAMPAVEDADASVVADAEVPVVAGAEPAAGGDIVGSFATDAAAAEADAARLEAALLDQLRSLEETLQPAPVRMPRVEPLRAPPASRARSVQPAEPAAAPGRSPFAPDPVRQRTYVDLRDAPAPRAASIASDDAPWRKYLAAPDGGHRSPRAPVSRPVSRAEVSRSPVSRPSVSRPAGSRPAAPATPGPKATDARRLGEEERGGGLRAMAGAAVLGLGIGLGLLVLLRPAAEDPAPLTAAVDLPASAVSPSADAAAGMAPAPQGPVGDALATLLADSPAPVPVHAGPAVIAEPGTPPEALVVAAAPPVPAAQPRPPLISPPPGQLIPVTRGALYGPDLPLAYGPTARIHDPVAQSLLRDTSAAAAEEEANPARSGGTATAARPAAIPRDGSRGTINSFVNLRARPDNGASVVAVLAQGLSVKVIGCDYWCEIEAGGKRGYVFKKFVSR
jgi:hypothetical protein